MKYVKEDPCDLKVLRLEWNHRTRHAGCRNEIIEQDMQYA